MITVWDVLLITLGVMVIVTMVSVIVAFTIRSLRDVMLLSLSQPDQEEPDLRRCGMNKDLDDLKPTLHDLETRNQLEGMVRCRPMTPEEREEQEMMIAANHALVEQIKAGRRALKEQDELVMELGDDVLKGYTPGSGGESVGR